MGEPVTEPVYVYKKGEGWVIRAGNLLTAEDFTDMQGRFPKVVNNEGWQRMDPFPRTQLKVGDLIPYSGVTGYVTDITDNKATIVKYWHDSGEYYDTEILELSDVYDWYDVRRKLV